MKDLSLTQLSYSNNTLSFTVLDNLVLDGNVKALFLGGSVVSIVVALNKSGCINQFSVLEWGTLGFFC